MARAPGRHVRALLAQVRCEQALYGVSNGGLAILAIAPFAAILALAVLIRMPATREATLWALRENSLVELPTFLILLGSGLYGLARVHARMPQRPAWARWFMLAFSAGLLAVAMEEIAWGQWLLAFETPETFARLNRQGELTLHNLPGMQGKTELLRLAYGAGGLVGCACAAIPQLRVVAAPLLLLPCFGAIGGHATVDLYLDYDRRFVWTDYYFNRTAEGVELLVGLSAGLYLHCKSKAFAAVGRTAFEEAGATPPRR